MRRPGRFLALGVLAGVLTVAPASSAPGSTCLIVSDAGEKADIQAPNEVPSEARALERHGDTRDPATDIRAVRLGYTEGVFTAEIRVASVRSRRPDGSGNTWEVAFRNAAGSPVSVSAHRDRFGDIEYRWSANEKTGAAGGALDVLQNFIRVEAPASLLGVQGGHRLTEIQARSWDAPAAAGAPRDLAPDQTDFGVAYVAGVPCAQQDARACPVVLDKRGDAGTIRRVHNRDVPESPAALDLTSAGAASDPATIRLSVKVPRPADEVPTGYTSVGWTVSWWDGAQRWYAQATRSARGTSFSYGVDPGGAIPTGPMAEGVPTFGRIDGQTVEIAIPRGAYDRSADGLRWLQFGATAWAMSQADTGELGSVNPFRVFDETPLARWRVGVPCAA